MPVRIVVDTNVYVSGIAFRSSKPGQAVSRALLEGTTLFSEPTWDELQAVFLKTKLVRYIAPETAQEFLNQARTFSDFVSIPFPIRACRDPRDDKFLEVAVHGRADVIVSGDHDLLVLHPFRGIPILTPAAFLAWSPHPLS